jgi:dihydrolipoamide dehydrogenase
LIVDSRNRKAEAEGRERFEPDEEFEMSENTSNATTEFDLLVLGAGPGGYVCAIRAAQLGLRTCLVEKRATLGGTCLNVGCIPSKALLESSELYAVVGERLAEHGIGGVAAATIDLGAMMARKDRIVTELVTGVAGLMKKNKVTVVTGRGTLAGQGLVRVEPSAPDAAPAELRAKNIVLATGSEPMALPFLPFDGRLVVDSTGALSLDRVPEHLVVVGAGAVGLELGSVWRRLGARVTVVEMLAQIAPFADTQMAKTLQRSLKQQGLDLKLKTRVTSARATESEVTLVLEGAKGSEEITADRVLVSVGRRPSTAGIGLEAAGVVLDEKGRVAVNERLATSAPSVYAIGDLVRGPMLAHKAEEEGIAVAEQIAGKPGHVNYEAIPNVIYTSPELAAVGLTEEEAKAQGLKVRIGRSLFRANGRAKSLGEEEGMVKVIADEKTDRLLGIHIVGPRASEMIAEAVVALEFRASAEDLARTSHAHPTLSEVLWEAMLGVDDRAIHA